MFKIIVAIASVIFIMSIFLAYLAFRNKDEKVFVGSKMNTESVLLAEIIVGLLKENGVDALHREQLGTTSILWKALLSKEIDMYVEFTGTLEHEIAKRKDYGIFLFNKGILQSKSLGYENCYALGMKKSLANTFKIEKISDLKRYKELKLGLTDEFYNREDGWISLLKTYNLPQKDLITLDHQIGYRALKRGDIAVTDFCKTDSEILSGDYLLLEDDLSALSQNTAVLLYKEEFSNNAKVLNVIKTIEGKISDEEIRLLNKNASLNPLSEKEVALSFLNDKFKLETKLSENNRFPRIFNATKQQIFLVFSSLFFAIIVAIPLGILAEGFPVLGQLLLGFTSLIQAIPSLALLVFFIPLLGIGVKSVIVALFFYSLLPILRNTFEGLKSIPKSYRDSAKIMGLSYFSRLLKIDLPLALPQIITGIKTAAVLNIGTATLAALVGAGGYGQAILSGIRLNSISLVMEGAIPAALLALSVQFLFEFVEKITISTGLCYQMGRKRVSFCFNLKKKPKLL